MRAAIAVYILDCILRYTIPRPEAKNTLLAGYGMASLCPFLLHNNNREYLMFYRGHDLSPSCDLAPPPPLLPLLSVSSAGNTHEE